MMHKKERRERLKQKYGGKTQLTNRGGVPLQRQSGGGHVAEAKQKTLRWRWGDPKFVKTRKQLFFFSVSQAGTDGTASVCVNMQTRWIRKRNSGLMLTGGDSPLLIFNWSSAEGHTEDWRVPVVCRNKDTGTASVSEAHAQPSHDSISPPHTSASFLHPS